MTRRVEQKVSGKKNRSCPSRVTSWKLKQLYFPQMLWPRPGLPGKWSSTWASGATNRESWERL